MITLLRELISLLNPSQKRRLLILQLLIIFMAFAEIVGVASIAPFMAVVVDTSLIKNNALLAQVYSHFGGTSTNWFIFWLGVATLVALSVSTCISVITLWHTSLFASDVGAELSSRLYQYYLRASWLFHVSNSSAQLTKQIATETNRITYGVLLPFTQMNARLVTSVCLSTALIIYNPIVAVIGLVVFATAYWVIYKLIKERLYRNGQQISHTDEERLRLLNDGIGGIKDVLLLNKQQNFIHSFAIASHIGARSLAVNSVLGMIPRYLIELVAFGSVILLVLFLIQVDTQSLTLTIPILSVYALAGLKLLPAFQQVYVSVAIIKGHISALESIKTDLHKATTKANTHRVTSQSTEILVPSFDITLNNISFCYPNRPQPALHNIYATIKANQTAGVVGISGSGKSTFIDVLLGLIEPSKGELLIDGTPINNTNRRAWQNAIGFVSQSIFLTEGTIAENVAFGLVENEIDTVQVQHALQLARLEEFVQTLPQGIKTHVGERGVKLSGGQRQRIGIARALYQNAQVLIFDEATNALDSITEQLVMDAVHDFGDKKTIVLVAHKLKTIRQCNVIFVMDKGQIIDSGTFQELQQKNPQFIAMVRHA